MFKKLIFLLVFLCFSFVSVEAWYDTTWYNRYNVTLNFTGNSSFTYTNNSIYNFPIALNGTSGIEADYVCAMRFIDGDDSSPRAFEIVNNTSIAYGCGGTNHTEVWGLIDEIPGNQNITKNISFVYINNTSYVAQVVNTTNVWNNSYMAVWHMDRGQGQLDSTANDVDYSSGTPVSCEGVYGNAIENDGTAANGIVMSGLSGANPTKLTISFWMNITDKTDNQRFLDWQDGGSTTAQMYWDASNLKWRIFIGVSWYSSDIPTAQIPVNKWVHIVGIWNSTHVQSWINGTNKGSVASASGQLSPGSTIGIGTAYTSGAEGMKGAIDEVQIMNYSVSDDWINASYQMGRNWLSKMVTKETAVVTNPIVITLELNGTQGNKNYLNNSVANITVSTDVRAPINLTSNITNWVTINKTTPYTYNAPINCTVNNTYYNFTAYVGNTSNNTGVLVTYHTLCYKILVPPEEPISIDECSKLTNADKIYEFHFFDETNVSVVNSSFVTNVSMDITFKVYNETYNVSGGINNYSLSLRNQLNYTICTNQSRNMTLDAIMDYWTTGYEHRNYYYVNATLQNISGVFTPNNQSLYLIGDTESDRIIFTIKDAEGNLEEDVYVKIQRYYVDTHTYRTVAVGKSDYLGQFVTYLEMYDVWYKFILEQNNKVIQTINPMKVASTEITLMVEAGGVLEWFQHYDKIAYNCSYNNITNNLACMATDTSGYVNTFCLNTTEIKPNNVTTLCETCDSSSSVTLSCNVGNATGRTIHYLLMAKTSFNPKDLVVIFSGILQHGAVVSAILGLTGVFMSLLITGTVSLIGLWRPSFSIVGMLVSLGVCNVFGLILVPWEYFFGLVFMGSVVIMGLERR